MKYLPHFILLFLLTILPSCTTHSLHWVSKSELFPSATANIKSVELIDGSVLEFNESRGWYDAEHQSIEGVTLTGWHPTIPLAKVQRAEIVEDNSNAAGTIGIVLLALLGFGLIGAIALASSFRSSGCLILIQLALVSAATMTVVLFMLR